MAHCEDESRCSKLRGIPGARVPQRLPSMAAALPSPLLAGRLGHTQQEVCALRVRLCVGQVYTPSLRPTQCHVLFKSGPDGGYPGR